jgi:hypothetical protein
MASFRAVILDRGFPDECQLQHHDPMFSINVMSAFFCPNSYLLLLDRELKHIKIQPGFLFTEYLPQLTLFIFGSA